VITLQFNLDLSLDIAEQEVQGGDSTRGRNLLPQDRFRCARSTPRSIRRYAPIMTLAVTSKSLAADRTKTSSKTRLAQKLSQQAPASALSA